MTLVNFFYAFNGASWSDNTNWLTGPVSTWNGITTFNNRVTSIDLNGNNLQGLIPLNLSDLSMLAYLDLSNNQVMGALPSSFSNFSF